LDSRCRLIYELYSRITTPQKRRKQFVSPNI
jgi:hypothetical protein